MTLSDDLPTILFSVETAARELDSKLVMAAALAQRGCRSIVGHKEAIKEIALNSRRVVWQGKSLFSIQSESHLADRLIANGSVIMFMTDEGAMHQADSWVPETLRKHWVDRFRTRHVGRLCVWGARQRDVIEQHGSELRNVLAVTGSARFDLCLPAYAWITEGPDQAALGAAPFILICTRFGALAHANGMGAPFATKLNPQAWPDQMRIGEITNLWFKKWRQDAHDFAEFVFLVKELVAIHPERRFVLRPHPSESLDFYRQAFATLKNVEVRREGNVLNWIRAAQLVIHSNCTTGIEAVLAGRPVVNFLPAGRDREGLDVEIAREAGTTVGSVPEALEVIERLLVGQPFSHTWSEHARRMLNNLVEDAVPILARETMAVLRDENVQSSNVTLPTSDGLRGTVRSVIKSKIRNDYVASKRGQMDGGHVEKIIAGCRVHGIGGGRLRRITRRYAVIDPA